MIPALKKEEPDDTTKPNDSNLIASLFGEGSVMMICSIIGVAVLAAIIIYLKKKKNFH